MPIIPSVFQPIRSNDFQQRPVKTYKHYKVSSNGFTTSSGYFRHNAIYRKHTPHIDADTGQGVGNRIYPVNSDDKANQHVVWNVIDHKYYRNYNPAQSADFLDIDAQKRFLWHSASLFTAPYGQVGEKIKHGTFLISASIGSTQIQLVDDGKGNLRDPLINTSSFASSSRNFFYMSFNNLYRKFNDYDELGSLGKGITYKLNNIEKPATINGTFTVKSGIEVTSSNYQIASGLSVSPDTNVPGNSIQIPHNDKFDRFGRCDDWTISLWHKSDSYNPLIETIFSKWGVTMEAYLDKVDGKRKIRKVETPGLNGTDDAYNTAAEFEASKIRTPMHLVYSGSADKVEYKFFACDGTNAVGVTTGELNIHHSSFKHICIRNSASKLEIFVNGVTGSGGTHGVLPDFTTNAADLIFGNTTSKKTDGRIWSMAEVRMYDYAVEDISITSLANNHYLSASCYQTNVAGNVFYKNGQVIASSPMPKYNSGSGIFGNTWNVTYRGTHTIYENECLVRVGKDQFNVTMNPTSTYRPITDGEPCDATQATLPPGELRKTLFVSGTLKPYITTIGLYNDESVMVASAKLAQPIQKNPDIDMNFIVRWDY